MKKLIYIFAIGFIASVFSACEDNTEIFEKSPSERIEAAIDAYSKALCDAPYGWEMRYFSTPNSAGYPLLVKFYDDTRVEVAGMNVFTNNKYVKSESYYNVIEGNGALLTFETYNEVLHAFSNPVNPSGKGQEGDYEFYATKITRDTIILSGKKRGTKVVLYRLDQKYENWQTYFEEVDAINKVSFYGNAGASFHMKVAGAGPYVTYNEYVFTQGESSYGFILTPTGIHLYDGFERNGQLAVNFVLDDLTNPTKFVCTDTNVTASIEPRYTPIQVYENNSKSQIVWAVDYKNMGSSAATIMTELEDSLESSGAILKEVDLLYVEQERKNALRFRYRLNDGSEYEGTELEALLYYTLTFSPATGKATSVKFEYASANTNGDAFLKRIGSGDIDAGAALVNGIFAHSYEVSCASGGLLNPSYLIFTAEDDANLNFTIHQKAY